MLVDGGDFVVVVVVLLSFFLLREPASYSRSANKFTSNTSSTLPDDR